MKRITIIFLPFSHSIFLGKQTNFQLLKIYLMKHHNMHFLKTLRLEKEMFNIWASIRTQ